MTRDLNLSGRTRFHQPTHRDGGEYASQWAILARSDAALGPLAVDPQWSALRPRGRTRTDDFSNLWSVIRWGEW